MSQPTRSLTFLTLAATASAALAQATQPAPSSHAALQQLDRETKALYADVQQSVVRISLPPPMWVKELAAEGSPLEKWKGELAPEVRQKLEEHVKSAQEGDLHDLNAAVTATSQPTTAPARALSTTTSHGGSFQMKSSRNAAAAMMKSIGPPMPAVHTGS